MSDSSEYLEDKKARKFDRLVSQAHGSRFYAMNVHAGSKGSSEIEHPTEKGLLLITKKYRSLVRDTRKRPRRCTA